MQKHLASFAGGKPTNEASKQFSMTGWIISHLAGFSRKKLEGEDLHVCSGCGMAEAEVWLGAYHLRKHQGAAKHYCDACFSRVQCSISAIN